MEIMIGEYAPETRGVPVTFTAGGITHSRDVNACLDADGDYDEEATAERVKDVALGVRVKIDLGVIRPVEPEAELPPAQDSAPTE